MNSPQVMFVLVHGAHVGAWVWDEVTPQLRLPSLAVNLPGHGTRAGILRSLTFAHCVSSIRAELPDQQRFILVGHSLGAPVVLALADDLGQRVAHIVLVAGPVPQPGSSIISSFPFLMRFASKVVLWRSGEEFTQSPRMAQRRLLNGLDAERARAACARFTPESRALMQEPLRWSGRPPAPCTYVRCLRDRGALPPDHQERMAANLGAGVKVVALDTCHYPMLQRPEQVATILNEVAEEVITRGT
jgi:pimeloyl-ACP methyl ester carboxylesterase